MAVKIRGRNALRNMLGSVPDITLAVKEIKRIRSEIDKSFERRRTCEISK